MRNLYETGAADAVKERMARLQPGSARQWGTMSVGQMIAHCCGGLETAVGDRVPPRGTFMGRMMGKVIKPMALGNDRPMRRNSPTTKDLLVEGERDLVAERERLCGLIDRFVAAGPKGCTKHPHAFFGKMTPEEWAELMYKHLDHHLRQFGV